MGTGVVGGDDGLSAGSGAPMGRLFEGGEGEEEEDAAMPSNSKTRRGPAGFNGNVVHASPHLTTGNGSKPAFKTGLNVGKV